MQYFKTRLEDLIAGLVTGGIGLFILIEASNYRLGTLTRMGPGYFPRLLGIAMLVLAVVMLITARPSAPLRMIDRGQVHSLLMLLAGFAAFGLTVERLGLLIAVALCVFLSALANPRTTLLTAFLLAAGSSVASVLLFTVALGLQIRAF